MEDPGKSSAARPGILFSSENAYTFAEVFLPVIQELGKVGRIYILVGNYHLSATVPEYLQKLKEDKVIETFQITDTDPKEKESLFRYHQRLQALTHSLSGLSLQMIVLGGDFQVAHRYLLNQFQDPRIQKVVLQGGLNIRVLQAYRKAKGLDDKEETAVGRLPKQFLQPLRFLKKKARRLRMDFRQWQNYYFFPYWQRKEVFPLTGYERMAFAAGLCPHVICYDRLMKEAIALVNPLVRHVHLAKHPLEGAKGNGSAEKRWEGHPKLMVLFAGNVATEMPEDKIRRWVEVTRQVVALKKFRAVDLRFHPRTSPALRWPAKMRKAMDMPGCSVEVVDTKQVGFHEGLDRYAGILGSPSAALRVARAMNKSMFIIGLANCSDGDLYDQSWALGEGKGIDWIREGTTVTLDQLNPPAMVDEQLPKVSDILLNLLAKDCG